MRFDLGFAHHCFLVIMF